ncbi:AraC family transcriptional regulator [Paractinoplanes atraurantiacus]|nr:AraC family transcriptional regulator [Actinoplanes atraurantiacus]
MDVVSEVLRMSGVRGSLGAQIEAGGRWAMDLDDFPGAALHVAISGGARVTVTGHEPVELAAGDVVLVRAGLEHRLSDSAGASGAPAAKFEVPEPGTVVRLGAPPVRTSLVTIFYDCDHTARTQVLPALPDLLHIPGGDGTEGVGDIVRLLTRELAHPQFAGTAVLDGLVDIMLIQLLRAWLPGRPGDQRGTWLGMLTDPVVHQALQHLHADPAHPWTTAKLASTLAVSRATLARRFPAAIGQSPLAYLTQWRMDLAAARLRGGSGSVEAIAASVGYLSVPAFSRAFTRAHGQAPGRFRSATQPA